MNILFLYNDIGSENCIYLSSCEKKLKIVTLNALVKRYFIKSSISERKSFKPIFLLELVHINLGYAAL